MGTVVNTSWDELLQPRTNGTVVNLFKLTTTNLRLLYQLGKFILYLIGAVTRATIGGVLMSGRSFYHGSERDALTSMGHVSCASLLVKYTKGEI